MRERLNELNREMANFAIAGLLDELREKYEDYPKVVEHLDAVQEDIVEHAEQFLNQNGQQNPLAQVMQERAQQQKSHFMHRYEVNVVIDNSESEGAPVVYEDNPTYQNLIGRVEHRAQMGALMTDFRLIKAGALHRANGGYLILDARKVLTQPYAWEGLKRALQSKEIRIESLGQMLSLISTISLEPESIPLDVKIALYGERILYYLLWQLDPEFADLFKVQADFEDQMDRDEEQQQIYARLIGSLAKREELLPLDRGAVARVIERSARIVGDSEKLTTHTRDLNDLLREANFWAKERERDVITAEDVQEAIDQQIYRADRVRDRMHEAILRDTLLIDTEGEKVAQVNGLAVLQMGNFAFGKPSRITARVRLGKGEVVDIEREVELGGPIHSKGVLILSGFLGARYAQDTPLSLSASLVFEQSYGGVEGDSASSAELYALLSAIAEVPIKQSFAVTGSVNQHGQVQAIGGVNEKIEGYFDICKARGLTGKQGMLIPKSNVKHLMLRKDVVEAVEAGDFHIHAVETVDEGIALLTGMPAGEPDEDGHYPEGSVNYLVEQRLIELAEKRRDFSEASKSSEVNESEAEKARRKHEPRGTRTEDSAHSRRGGRFAEQPGGAANRRGIGPAIRRRASGPLCRGYEPPPPGRIALRAGGRGLLGATTPLGRHRHRAPDSRAGAARGAELHRRSCSASRSGESSASRAGLSPRRSSPPPRTSTSSSWVRAGWRSRKAPASARRSGR